VSSEVDKAMVSVLRHNLEVLEMLWKYIRYLERRIEELERKEVKQ